MGADNWTNCPACVRQRDDEWKRRKAAHDATYGKVPAEDFVAATRALADEYARVVRNFEETFREDYEIGIDEGAFSVSYSGKCRCGFSHRFTWKDTLELPPAAAAVDPQVAK